MMSAVHAPLWRVKEALNWAMARLEDTVERSLSARMLLAHALECTTTDLFVHPERALRQGEEQIFRQLVARRARHEPVAYLLGHRPFLDLDLIVDHRVLIPRPETERLVEQAITTAQHWQNPVLADVGTGSGVIAVSLAKHHPAAHVFAIDCSSSALRVAAQNVDRYGVSDRVTLLHGDLFAPLPVPVNVIVANLPYVSEAEYAALPPDIRLHEPRQALLAGTDGLDTIRALVRTARPHLSVDGAILLEIGATQGAQVAQIARQAFPDAAVSILQDDAHRDRLAVIALPPPRREPISGHHIEEKR